MPFSLKNWFNSTFGFVFGKAAKAIKPRQKSTLTDRLLADAIQLSELPSPVPGEEPRAAFVLERLKNFGFLPQVTEAGDIQVRLHSPQAAGEAPILLFADLGSKRWHPSESLARLDAENAIGAGLSDSLGCAALLSIAEQWQEGFFQNSEPQKIFRRDLLLLFTAKSLDDPNIGFSPILNSQRDRPFAAIGVRGLSLDRIIHSTGSYRLKICISSGSDRGETETPVNKVTETLIDTARTLLGITWDTEGKTKMFIRRLEALSVYAQTPQEGLLELDIVSSEAALLELAMNAVKATAGKIGESAGLKTETSLESFIPPGKPEKSRELFEILIKLLREQRIKAREETAADPASYFSGEDIPALSLGIALGREGTVRDIINIDSVDDGRRILERLIDETGARDGF